MGWWRAVLRSLWSSLSKEVREHVGTDHLGNKYYYIAQYKNWRGQTIREKRIVEAANRKELDYEAGDIPTEWEAWIRRTRKTPPTMEHIWAWTWGQPVPRKACQWEYPQERMILRLSASVRGGSWRTPCTPHILEFGLCDLVQGP
uniref:NADH dehydrogenase [ubiquinone] 1 alpha subcomplex assembly factor 2 isoform X2 n=1 Tax=Myodes glareolus TaxID=447135 RepID=UPI00202083AF|nr:NADH dehydrogenase [ubiquinone] 1 alpha subcomplex assembly factor 2 isoform X2 [Myodes glareolus]